MNSELNFNEMPICPHCKGEHDIDEHESYGLYDDVDDYKIVCSECEKTYWIQSNISYTFNTSKEPHF